MATVVLAESYRLARPLLAAVLKRGGHEVYTASDVQETIKSVIDHRPDVLVIDLDAPMCGSVGTVAFVRRLTSVHGVRVLGLTYRRERAFLRDAVRAGVTGVLLKEEFGPECLLKRIDLLCADLAPSAAAPASAATTTAAGTTLRPPARANAADAPADGAPAGDGPDDAARVRGAGRRAIVVPIVAEAAPPPGGPTSQEGPAGPPPPPLKPAEVERKLADVAVARALRPVVHQVMALTADPDADVAMLVEVLRADVELSAKVLAAANSAFYRRSKSAGGARGLADAISLIGLKGTRELALSLSVSDAFRPPHADPLLGLPNLWSHSVTTAHLCEALARQARGGGSTRLGEVDPEQAFLLGLLHDLGRRHAAEHFPDHYRHVVYARPATAPPLAELERRVLGADHAHVGSQVMTRWGCPDALARAVRLHHQPPQRLHDDPLSDLLRVLTLADGLAVALGFPADDLDDLPAIPRSWLLKWFPPAAGAEAGTGPATGSAATGGPATGPDPAATHGQAAAFRQRVLASLQERQGLMMSRANLPFRLPDPWAGAVDQLVVLGTPPHPLEPLQLLLTRAYPTALAAPAQADLACPRTLVLADLRSCASSAEQAGAMAWLNKVSAPPAWPVLVAAAETVQPSALGLRQRPAAVVAGPTRPAVVRAAVEPLVQALAAAGVDDGMAMAA